jgi:parallel beta-helix repeat protein
MTKTIKPCNFKDFYGHLSKTYVIDEPGIYHLCQSIDFVPIVEGQSAIQILADDVTLDLCGHILRQTNDILNVTGVRLGVEDGSLVFKNITIKNGKIHKFTGQAIGSFNAVESSGVFDNLTFSELDCSECGSDPSVQYASGINLQSNIVAINANVSDGVPYINTYTNVTIEHCQVNNCLGNGAIAVYACDGLIMNDVQANGTSLTVPYVFTTGLQRGSILVGLRITGKNIQLTNVQGNNTHCPSDIDEVGGLYIWNASSVSLNHCEVNDILSEGDGIFIFGLSVFACDNIQIEDCQFNNVTSKGVVFGTGNQIDVTPNVMVHNTTFNNVQRLATIASNADIAGLFTTSGNNHYYSNCQFNNAFSVSGDICAGANFSAAKNIVCENCQFNNTDGGINLGISNGIHNSDGRGRDELFPANFQKYINCQFNGIKGFNRVEGITGVTNVNLLFDGCQATNITSTNGIAIGFSIFTNLGDVPAEVGSVYNITFRKCVVSDVHGVTETHGILTGARYTFPNFIGIGGITKNIVIQDCILERISSSSSSSKVAGISEIFISTPGRDFDDITGIPQLSNISVTDCRISDVRAGAGNPFSAGILLESVAKPMLSNNSVSDCDRGILFTGSIEPCFGFQLATSLENALAVPPVVVDLLTSANYPSSVEALLNTFPISPDPGYLSGPNDYGDKIQTNRYITADHTGTLTQIQFGFFNLFQYRFGSVGKAWNITLRIYDSDITGTVPNNIVQFVTFSVASLNFQAGANDVESAIYNWVLSAPITIGAGINSLSFFIAVDFSDAYNYDLSDLYLIGSYLTTVGTVIPDNRAYIEWSDNSWNDYQFAWGFNGDLWINPLINAAYVNNAQTPSVPYQSFYNADRENAVTSFTTKASRDAITNPTTTVNPLANVLVTTNVLGLGPFFGALANFSPALTVPVYGIGANTVDSTTPTDDACEPLVVPIPGKIGVCRRGTCAFVNKTTNIEAAGGIATIYANNANPMLIPGGSATGTGPSVLIPQADGNTLIAAIGNNPNIEITLSFVSPQCSFQEWQTGDQVVYSKTNVANVSELVDGQMYYAVMGPGFTTQGLVKQNEVTNCSISGYQDDQVPTSSAWINNVALLNGSTHDTNYDVTWSSGTKQVDEGSLGEYPTVEHKYWNLSLTQ